MCGSQTPARADSPENTAKRSSHGTCILDIREFLEAGRERLLERWNTLTPRGRRLRREAAPANSTFARSFVPTTQEGPPVDQVFGRSAELGVALGRKTVASVGNVNNTGEQRACLSFVCSGTKRKVAASFLYSVEGDLLGWGSESIEAKWEGVTFPLLSRVTRETYSPLFSREDRLVSSDSTETDLHPNAQAFRSLAPTHAHRKIPASPKHHIYTRRLFEALFSLDHLPRELLAKLSSSIFSLLSARATPPSTPTRIHLALTPIMSLEGRAQILLKDIAEGLADDARSPTFPPRKQRSAPGPGSHVQGDDEETSPAPSTSAGSIVFHLTPDTDGDAVRAGSESFDSPSPAARRYQRLPSSSPEDAKGTPPSGDSSFSSFEHVELPSPTQTVSHSRRSSTDSNRLSVLPPSLHSFPPVKKVVLSAPDPNSPPQQSTYKAHRSKLWSGAKENQPGSAITTAPDGAEGQGAEGVRRRTSLEAGLNHSQHSRRSSITPGLSSIPDEQESTKSRGSSGGLLDPNASIYSPPHVFAKLSLAKKFDHIILTGKGEDGELTKEARAALKSIGLRPIAAMHGPLSLPYARCPSGIDAFLFSADKEEDPWTFLLEDGSRRRRNTPYTKANPVALPGNARYAQASHIQHGRLPTRIVSAPAVLLTPDEIYTQPNSLQNSLRGSQHGSRPSVHPGEDAASVAQILAAHHAAQYVQQAQQAQQAQQPAPVAPMQYYTPTGDDWAMHAFRPPSSTGSHFDPYSRPPSTIRPLVSQSSFTWPTAPPPFNNFPMMNFTYPPALSALLPPHPIFNPTVTPQPSSFVDPAILATFGGHSKDLDAVGSSYYTADSETDEEEEHGGFFFPAIAPAKPPLSPSSSWSRRASNSTAIPGPPRRPSINPAEVLAPVANADRRNSAAPFMAARKMSLAPAVTVSTRRQSIAAQTRLVRDSNLRESHPTRQPRPPPTEATPAGNLVPHHSRPASLSSLYTANKALSRKSSLVAARRGSQSVLAEANIPPVVLKGKAPLLEDSKEQEENVAATGSRAETPEPRKSENRSGETTPRGRGFRG
ncbi:hypothetical protein P7C70_g8406, partial [Phenoliferia sp. Uapishka_3]